MGIEVGILCRECGDAVHLSKLYFPREWTDGLVEEQIETDSGQYYVKSMMSFMARHKGHHIELLDEHHPDWGELLTNT